MWNEYIQRYHYLGYTAMSGSQLRYSVYADDKLLALLSFGASAWKLAARDTFIGWQDHQRRKNLHLMVNNARFLILPWIQCKGLASKILSIVNRQLPIDWQQRYRFKPVLLETFVECERHRGTSYKAANWIFVGKTVGRGKKSRVHSRSSPSRTSGSTHFGRTSEPSSAPEATACKAGIRVHRMLTEVVPNAPYYWSKLLIPLGGVGQVDKLGLGCRLCKLLQPGRLRHHQRLARISPRSPVSKRFVRALA